MPESPLPDASGLEAIAVQAAREGADRARRAPDRIAEIRTKSSPTDPVTALDVDVERVVQDVLAEQTPDASILGEEQGGRDGRSALGWIVDPIDGTVNLTYDLPVIAVSVAAAIDGEVVAGAVVDVQRGEVFSAAQGTGARRDGVAVRPSTVDALAHALVGTGFSYAAEERASEATYLHRVLPAARDIRVFGSAALNLCWVACGRLDGFYQRHMERWDYAAGLVIAQEAGAMVESASPENGELTVVASPMVFDDLRQLVA